MKDVILMAIGFVSGGLSGIAATALFGAKVEAKVVAAVVGLLTKIAAKIEGK